MADSVWDDITPKSASQWIAALLCLAFLVAITFWGGKCSLTIGSPNTTTTTTTEVARG